MVHAVHVNNVSAITIGTVMYQYTFNTLKESSIWYLVKYHKLPGEIFNLLGLNIKCLRIKNKILYAEI